MIYVGQDASENKDYIDAYSSSGEHLGIYSRNHVHNCGLLHYAVHCWVYFFHNNQTYVLFQKRKNNKRLFPGLYDVAAAGHYIAGEFGSDGLRELEEELNYSCDNYDISYFNKLDCFHEDSNIVNNEICNVYLCKSKKDLLTTLDIRFNKEEIEDLIAVEAEECLKLLKSEVQSVDVYSFSSGTEFNVSQCEFIIEYIPYFCDIINAILQIPENYVCPQKSYTFAMLKPDSIKRELVPNVIAYIKDKGFNIELFDITDATEEKIYKHYANKIEEEGEIYKKKAWVYFNNQKVIPMILSYDNDSAIKYLREIIGYKDPQFADKCSIRGRWGIDSMEKSEQEIRCCENLIHASDSVASFREEVLIWFDRDVVEHFM